MITLIISNLWNMMPRSYPEDWGSRFLLNIDFYLSGYTATHKLQPYSHI